jgi:hypothetical protein
MNLTIEQKLVAIWILWFIALTIYHFMTRDMIKYELKKLEEKLSKK